MKVAILAGLMTAGLVAGCGGAEAVDTEQPDLVSREDQAKPPCRSEYDYEYFSDSTYTEKVGAATCICDSILDNWGQVTPYKLGWTGGRCGGL